MTDARRIRDSALIDAIEAAPSVVYEGAAWRVVRDGRDPLQGSGCGGRWDDGTFDVLYTSEKADGAVAEMYFHLSRGQPVIPSKVRYHLHELSVTMQRALKLADLQALAELGMETDRSGALAYVDRVQEYPRPQEIAETAHFVGFDGLLVPNARHDCLNIVLFCDRISPDAVDVLQDHGLISWDDWRKTPLGF